jgi:alkylation response protein AidB-like acyl-CoA dehydrogenase
VVIPAFQEPSAGLDLADTVLSATATDGQWRLTGRKSFVPGASTCEGFLVNARGSDGLLVCFVDRKAPGLTIRSVPTVDGRSYGELIFDDVPAKSVMERAEDAAAILRRYLGLMLVATSAEMLGVMEGVNDMTLEYLKTRKQFGRAIGSFQALQHRAVDNYVLIESTRSLLHQVCGGGEPVPEALASALKAVASSAALAVTKSAVQLHGAIGFTDEYDAGLFLKRAMWLSSYFGNEAVHRRRYANLS